MLSIVHQKLTLWNAKGEPKVVKANGHPCYMQKMHVDFKMYEPKFLPLEVKKDAIDPIGIKSCQLGPNGYRLVTKAEGGSTKDFDSQ